jgi:ubiquinone/menaquinone biosynthesis C-methylase UbiE
MAMNYFEGSSSAKHYARFRPYFHPLVIERIGEITGPVECALDVGCGTGQSALALLAVAGNVFGVDAAGEMLRYAPQNRRITLREAPAEALPFTDDSFDLLSASLAFHLV